jgi:hypothetical protein
MRLTKEEYIESYNTLNKLFEDTQKNYRAGVINHNFAHDTYILVRREAKNLMMDAEWNTSLYEYKRPIYNKYKSLLDAIDDEVKYMADKGCKFTISFMK